MATNSSLIASLLFLLSILLRPAEPAGVPGGRARPAWQQPYQQYPTAAGYYPSSPPGSSGWPRWDPYGYGRCLGSLIMEGSCAGQILSSFWTGRIYLSPGCCESVRRVDDECVTTAFAALANPYFGYALKGYCAATRAWVQSLD
ncbi:unnamed protein product [Linum tenue]|uniref:Prolamin-like domain-containing protein n=1 Tax=Linum tenue TaxID=586396 RepID=A0AAV0HWM6_9ROSI|nr:unnamed protein product [Linum tenue]